MKKGLKIFMIFCILFSQFSGAISVLADEIIENIETEERVLFSATIDSDNNLVINSIEDVDVESNYDVYISSYYKYDYDNSVIPLDNNLYLGSVSGEILNGDGYSVLIDGVDDSYNGELFVSAHLVDLETLEKHEVNVSRVISNEDVFDIYANEEVVVDNAYTVSDVKEVVYSYDAKFYGILGATTYDVLVNDNLITDSFSVNYEGMLYGDYLYNFDVIVDSAIYTSSLVKTSYNCELDENNVCNDEMLTAINTMGVKFDSGNAYVMGSFEENIINILDFVTAVNLADYEVEVLDSEGNVVEDVISNDMVLSITKDGLVLTYNIIIVGDVNSDNIVNDQDVLEMIDSVLGEEEYYHGSADVNNDSIVDILDITKVDDAIINGWENEVEVDLENILSPTIKSDIVDSANIGDTFTVRFYLDNFNDSIINGLEGIISYDNSIVSLGNVSANGMELHINEDGRFILIGDYSGMEDALIELEFTVEGASDDEYISISGLKAAYAGENVKLSSDTVSLNFTTTYIENVGGDVSDEEVLEEEETEVVLVDRTYVYNILSSDSYLADLKIDGYEIDFSPYTYSYNISVDSDVDSLDLSVLLSDYRASYTIYGNEDFKAGENIVTIVVEAEDGSTHTYTLIVDKAEEEVVEEVEVEEESNGNITKTIIIILIVLVIIGLIYLIFKDDEEDKDSKNNNSKKKD